MDIQAKLNEAMALHQQGQLKEAKEKYLEVLSHTDNADLYYLLALTCFDLNQHKEAIKYAKLGEKLAPENQDFWTILANSYSSVKDAKTSAEYLQKLIRKNPNDAQSYLLLAKQLYALNQFYQAAKTYKRATEIEPSLNVKFEPLGNILGA